MADTIFAKIIRRELPADIVYEDEEILAFKDIQPQTPHHVLFIPKRPIVNLDQAKPADALLLGKLLLAAAEYARRQGLGEQGYRAVINCNAYGGQTVDHLHIHLLAGRPMDWPPG